MSRSAWEPVTQRPIKIIEQADVDSDLVPRPEDVGFAMSGVSMIAVSDPLLDAHQPMPPAELASKGGTASGLSGQERTAPRSLEAQYAAAYAEWTAAGEADVWAVTTGDGLGAV